MTTNTSLTGKLLVVDDEPVAVKNLAYALRKSGHQVVTRTSGSGALATLEKETFDVILTDLRMERVDGLAVLRRALEIDPDVAVIMITGHATLGSAVDAMKAGAFHYIAKPFRLEEVREVVRSALELVRLKRENQVLRDVVASGQGGPRIITQDAAMLRLLDTARQVAPTDCNILIIGESGTGKELVARYLHTHSGRAEAPFVAINCGALHEELLANELFGHEKGAYTGATDARAGLIEAADGGTLFLDEIAEMPASMQVKLLRVIQEHEVLRLGATQPRPVNVRFIAASLRDLRTDVENRSFRQDLYFRLNVVALHLPPLVERRDDVPLLAWYFLRKHALRMGKNIEDINAEVISLLTDYDYPGNVRELENIIERGVALAAGESLTARDLPPALSTHAISVVRSRDDGLPTLEQREADYISWVLERTSGNRSQAAEILGIDRVSLWRKLKRYNLSD
ncbi:MAG: sigma-54-dependent Fis family transcriptional regulator [Thiogranum sp.]|nr:sigma-54-dependent Fis family transcriptional regulator [Thiogranum sp.]